MLFYQFSLSKKWAINVAVVGFRGTVTRGFVGRNSVVEGMVEAQADVHDQSLHAKTWTRRLQLPQPQALNRRHNFADNSTSKHSELRGQITTKAQYRPNVQENRTTQGPLAAARVLPA